MNPLNQEQRKLSIRPALPGKEIADVAFHHALH